MVSKMKKRMCRTTSSQTNVSWCKGDRVAHGLLIGWFVKARLPDKAIQLPSAWEEHSRPLGTRSRVACRLYSVVCFIPKRGKMKRYIGHFILWEGFTKWTDASDVFTSWERLTEKSEWKEWYECDILAPNCPLDFLQNAKQSYRGKDHTGRNTFLFRVLGTQPKTSQD